MFLFEDFVSFYLGDKIRVYYSDLKQQWRSVAVPGRVALNF